MTSDEAEQYTAYLRDQIIGILGMLDFAIDVLNVPDALGMEPRDWVMDHCGEFWDGVAARYDVYRDQPVA